jgi:hypothetical protein
LSEEVGTASRTWGGLFLVRIIVYRGSAERVHTMRGIPLPIRALNLFLGKINMAFFLSIFIVPSLGVSRSGFGGGKTVA